MITLTDPQKLKEAKELLTAINQERVRLARRLRKLTVATEGLQNLIRDLNIKLNLVRQAQVVQTQLAKGSRSIKTELFKRRR